MKRPIDVTADQRKILLALLERYLPNTEAWVYGSRVKWTSRPQSDLDLVVFATPEQERRVSDLREAFEESNLPFRVDLFVWDSVPEQFHKQIEADHVVLAERDERGVVDGWRETTLGEVVTLQRGFDLPTTERKLGSYPVIASTGQVGTHNRAIVQGPGVVIGRSGSLGGGQFIKGDFWPLNTTLWVKDFNNNDPRFCYFLLKSLDLGQFNAGSGVPTLNRNHIHPLPVHVPLPPEQRAVAHILGTLDDKIELNRRMNETLEAMARALFKSWFVDFDPVRAKAALKRHAAAHAPLEEESAYITPPLRGSRQGKDEVRGRAGGGTNRWGDIKRQYTQQTLQNAKTLRQTQTNAEGLLWHYLRDKQLDGHNFRRQQPIGPYIADFACMSQKLLIELDGGGHTERKAHDRERDEFLRQRGYRVLRFWNNEVFENCLGVLERVYEALTSPPPRQPIPVGLAAVTPPQGGSDLMDEWTLERARTYLDGMGEEIAALFPDSFVDSELGEIPEGWGVGTLGDMLHQRVERCRASEETASCPYVPIDCISPKSLFLTESKPGEEAKSSLTKFYTGDILFGAMRPYFHKVCIAPFDGTTRTTAFVFYPKREHDFAFATLLLHDPDTIDFATRNSTGSTIPYAVWQIQWKLWE